MAPTQSFGNELPTHTPHFHKWTFFGDYLIATLSTSNYIVVPIKLVYHQERNSVS